MRAIDLALRQLDTVHSLFLEIADDLTAQEWAAQAVPGSNRLGFTLWHLPRTQDWAVQTVLRGAPEVLAEECWQGRGRLQTPGIGAGFTRDEADAIAYGVAPADVLAYADAVHQAATEWLRTLDDGDLDTVPDMLAHQAPYPAYQHPGFLAEVQHLVGMPTWRFLLGPCSGHLRSHLGELELLKHALRASDQAG